MRPRAVVQSVVFLGVGVAVGYWVGSNRPQVQESAPRTTTTNSRPETPAAGLALDRVEAADSPKRAAVEMRSPPSRAVKAVTSLKVAHSELTEGQAPEEIATAWRSDIQQIQDPGKRSRALAELRDALGGTDRTRMLAALQTFRGIYGVEYDKASFHSLVEGHLQSPDAEVKRAAVVAFCATGGPQPDARPLVSLASDPDPQVRSSIAQSMLLLTRETTDPAVEGIYTSLLADKDPSVLRSTFQTLCQTQTTEAVEEHLVHLATDPAMQPEVCRVLATRMNKSDAAVDLLLRGAASSDPNTADSCVRGLSNGLRDDQRERALDEIVRSLGSAPSLTGRWSYFQMIERFGSQRHIPTLQDLASNPMVDEKTRAYVDRIIAKLGEKKDG